MVEAGLVPTASAEQKNDLCSRPDVLSFASAPFTGEIRISGGIRIRLLVSSDAADTAFTVKLSEEFAGGKAIEIRDDISTLSLRNGAAKRLAYKQNEQTEIVFDLPPIDWQLQPGSRLRLDISSSNFPAFNAHPNKAGLWSTIADPVIARQTLHQGAMAIPIVPSRPANPPAE